MKKELINAAAVNIKAAAELKSANKEFTTISSTLRFMQTREMLDAGYSKMFAKYGCLESITVPAFFAQLHPCLHGTDKKGNDYVGIWGMKTTKDANGNVVSEEEVLRKVTAWNPTKVFRVLEQSYQAYKADNNKEEAEVVAPEPTPEPAPEPKAKKESKSKGKGKGGKKGAKAA